MADLYTSYSTSLALRDAGARQSKTARLMADPEEVRIAGEKILRRVHYAPGSCWIWTGAVNTDGYGAAEIGAIDRGGRVTVAPHRVIYRWLAGALPPGFVIDHLCRERRCVNPQHMEPVTVRTNTLTGIGPTATNAAASVCETCGGPFILANSGKRICRPCHIRRSTARQERMKQEAAAGTPAGIRWREQRVAASMRQRKRRLAVLKEPK